MRKLIVATLMALATVTPAAAHVHMEMGMPAADSTVKSPKSIMVHFNGKVEGAMSGFEVTGPGGAVVPLTPAVDETGTMVAAPVKGKLAPGVYTVKWHAVSADGHRMTGHYSFTVK